MKSVDSEQMTVDSYFQPVLCRDTAWMIGRWSLTSI
jgi:hypothetical protein